MERRRKTTLATLTYGAAAMHIGLCGWAALLWPTLAAHHASDDRTALAAFDSLRPFFFAAGIWVLLGNGLLAVYLVLASKNAELRNRQKALWFVGFITFNVYAFVAYFLIHLRAARKP